MATYKVIQDIEAEDKFLGPLTLKQFIFAAITLISAYLSFFFLTKGIWFLVLPLLPIMLVGGFLAFPWGRDQPTETWLLAKLRFWLKPHLRVWDQTGMQELVTITAPKNPEQLYGSDNLSQTEVKSRLKALADTIDTRGWAVKNSSLNMMAAPTYAPAAAGSDRLLDMTMPTVVPITDVQAADDILDERYSPVAQHFNQMINTSTKTHRKETLQKMEDMREGKLPAPVGAGGGQPGKFWFMDRPSGPVPAGYATFGAQNIPAGTTSAAPVAAGPLSTEEKALLDKIHQEQSQPKTAAYGQMKVIEPLSAKKPNATKQLQKPVPTAPLPTNPNLLQLAGNDDLSIATIARQAHKDTKKQPPEDEVVISLH